MTAIRSTNAAFVALHVDGTVTTWGDASYGGDSSSVDFDGDLDDLSVVGIYPSERLAACAATALSSPGDLMSLVATARVFSYSMAATSCQYHHHRSAYAALRADGSVVTWGYAQRGGLSDSVASALDGSMLWSKS